MRTGIIIDLTPADRRRLGETVADRNSPQKHVRRARIVLLTADGAGTAEIMREAGVSKTAVWRWQERFMQEGVDGLLRDKTRPSRIPGARGRDRRSCDRPDPGRPAGRGDALDGPGDGRSRRHQRQLGAAHLALAWASAAPGAPVQAFQGPQFAAKVRDIVGLYVDPPAHAVVLSVDEKSQIQALDRTQPGLPLKKGRAGTMTHDYKRHGTTTLFAALDVLEGRIIGRCMQRNRHQEFIRFLNAVEAEVPASKVVHAILDNYAVHKTRR